MIVSSAWGVPTLPSRFLQKWLQSMEGPSIVQYGRFTRRRLTCQATRGRCEVLAPAARVAAVRWGTNTTMTTKGLQTLRSTRTWCVPSHGASRGRVACVGSILRFALTEHAFARPACWGLDYTWCLLSGERCPWNECRCGCACDMNHTHRTS
jgi:hypothetical protein